MRTAAAVFLLAAVISLIAFYNPSQPAVPDLSPAALRVEPAATSEQTIHKRASKADAQSTTPTPKNELAPKPSKPRYRSHWPVRNKEPEQNFFVSASARMVSTVSPDVLQGATTPVTITGTGFTTVNGITGSTGVTVGNIVLVSSTVITADATVDPMADVGDQIWVLDMTGGFDSAMAFIVPPTDVLPATDDTEPSRNPAVAGVNVFLHNGEFFTSATDLATRGRMMGIHWSRFYSSNNAYNGPLGYGWMGYYYQRAIFDSGTDDITWYAPNGRTEVFTENGGVWDAPAGVYITASFNVGNGKVTLVDRHGFTCVFNADGRLESCTDRNGNSTTCSYNADGQLDTVTDDRGMDYEITYYAHGRVETVSDKVWSTGSPRVIEYAYDSNGDLTTFKAPETARYNDGDGNRTTYEYTYTAHRLETRKNPHQVENSGDAYLINTYDTGRVIQQVLGTSGQKIYLRYHSSTVVREVDRRELRTDYTIDGSGRATAVKRFNHYWSVDTSAPIDHTTITKTSGTDVRGSSGDDDWTTALSYNSNNEVTSVTYPRTNTATYAYPSSGSQTSGTSTSCSNTNMEKTSAGWGTNAYAGMTLRMGTSPANWRTYPIVSNDSDTIVVAGGNDLDADGWSASAYLIYNQATQHPDPLARGNVLSVTRADGSVGALSDIVSSYTYEPRYQFVKTAKDPRNNVTTYKYDYEATSPATTEGNLIETRTATITAYLPDFSTTTTYQVVNQMAYNGSGQATSATDGEGNVTSFSYYSGGNTDGFLYQRIVNPGGGNLNLTTEFDYNRAGLTIAMWPPRAFDGGVTKDDFKTSYDVNELNQVTHTAGRKLLAGQNDRMDSHNYYDLNGNLTQRFDEYVTSGGTEPSAPGDVDDPGTFSKSSSPMATTWIETTHTYGLLNQRLTTVADAIAGVSVTRFTTTYNYDDNYNQIRTITPLGFEHETVLDERELVFKRIAAEGAGGGIEGVFRSDYDDNGNLSASFDALANQTAFVHDGFERQTKVTDPELHYRETDYDAASNVTETRVYDYNSGGSPLLLAQTQYTYDEINRAKQTRRLAKDRSGSSIGDGWSDGFTAYDMNSRGAASKDDNGVIHTTIYDDANRAISSIDAVGNVVDYTYNSDGAVTRVDYDDYNPLTPGTESSHTESDLDFMNRVIRFRDQRYNVSTRNTEVEHEYDSLSRTVKTTDATNKITLNYFDLLSRLTRNDRYPSAGLSGDTVITTYQYDDDSRNTHRRIFNDGSTMSTPQVTQYNYDARNRLIEIIRPDSDDWDFTYDAQNRTGWVDPMGTTVTETFDDRNLVTQRGISRGSGVKGVTKEQYAYDGLGRLTMGRNYENNGGGDLLHTENEWAYNTLSLPERHVQEIVDTWTKTRTFTSDATYDAAGFNLSHTYASGRNVTYEPDGQNRLAAINDVTHSKTDLATFAYAGPNRLIQRTLWNGTKTIVAYEAAGCGCGGFSGSYVESVLHNDGDDITLFREERRFDLNGNPAAARWEHLGNRGEQYTYDDTYRLTNVIEGVPFHAAATDDFDDPTTAATVFVLDRAYAFDTRSNRTGVTTEDISSGTILSDSYSPDADTNVYNTINSQTYLYDAAENQTLDPTTGLYKAYDYLGRLVAEDTDSNLATPEKVYRYDVHSRMRVEETNFDASYHNAHTTFYECFANDPGGSGGCGGNPGIIYASETRVDYEDADMRTVEYTIGVGVTGSMSGSATSPWLASQLPRGSNNNKNVVLVELFSWDDGEAQTYWQYRAENQQRSLLGVSNEDGYRRAEVDYGEYGLAHLKKILWDGRNPAWFLEILADDENMVVTLTAPGGFDQPVTNDMLGALARVVTPNDAPYVLFGRVVAVDPGNDEFTIEDPTGELYTAMDTHGGYLTVFDHHDANIDNTKVHTAGLWDDNPALNSGDTDFDDPGNYFPTWCVGWHLQPDARYPVFHEIIAASAGTITVKGDVTGTLPDVNENDVYYFIIPPVGVDKTSGALSTAPTEPVSRYLAFQYFYIAPMVGVYVDDERVEPAGIYGAQAGDNLAGQYYCWHRFYQPDTGRWTTPDPAMTPHWNLQLYSATSPAKLVDPTGLLSVQNDCWKRPGGCATPEQLERVSHLPTPSAFIMRNPRGFAIQPSDWHGHNVRGQWGEDRWRIRRDITDAWRYEEERQPIRDAWDRYWEAGGQKGRYKDDPPGILDAQLDKGIWPFPPPPPMPEKPKPSGGGGNVQVATNCTWDWDCLKNHQAELLVETIAKWAHGHTLCLACKEFLRSPKGDPKIGGWACEECFRLTTIQSIHEDLSKLAKMRKLCCK